MKKYRIRKWDTRNWVIERYSPPRILKAGKRKGQLGDPTWANDGYYGRLEDIPGGLLKKYLNGTFEDAQSVINAIEKAKEECLEVLKEFIKESKNDTN